MGLRQYFLFVCVLFGFISLVHLLVLLSGWTLQIENFIVPKWISVIALFVTGYLSYESFRHWRKG